MSQGQQTGEGIHPTPEKDRHTNLFEYPIRSYKLSYLASLSSGLPFSYSWDGLCPSILDPDVELACWDHRTEYSSKDPDYATSVPPLRPESSVNHAGVSSTTRHLRGDAGKIGRAQYVVRFNWLMELNDHPNPVIIVYTTFFNTLTLHRWPIPVTRILKSKGTTGMCLCESALPNESASYWVRVSRKWFPWDVLVLPVEPQIPQYSPVLSTDAFSTNVVSTHRSEWRLASQADQWIRPNPGAAKHRFAVSHLKVVHPAHSYCRQILRLNGYGTCNWKICWFLQRLITVSFAGASHNLVYNKILHNIAPLPKLNRKMLSAGKFNMSEDSCSHIPNNTYVHAYTQASDSTKLHVIRKL